MNISLENFKEDKKLFIDTYLKINIDNIENELMELPHIYGIFGELLTSARLDYENKEAEFTFIYNKVRDLKLTDLSNQGRKPTDKQLDSMTESSEDVINIKYTYIKAKNLYESVKEMLQALSYKKDVLVQLSANQRQEKKLYV